MRYRRFQGRGPAPTKRNPLDEPTGRSGLGHPAYAAYCLVDGELVRALWVDSRSRNVGGGPGTASQQGCRPQAAQGGEDEALSLNRIGLLRHLREQLASPVEGSEPKRRLSLCRSQRSDALLRRRGRLRPGRRVRHARVPQACPQAACFDHGYFSARFGWGRKMPARIETSKTGARSARGRYLEELALLERPR
jgi:hypothetical protein